ncbi:DUF86 [Desulfonema limicola]|uniref:DUF86 n=1 Tax=Desulfonema limicola TaxID=45656 RepID=A0A975B5N2_9BACT|nr:DUF86 domain-containing protein [Desulfonema limicola]QTA79233.1 DUF86 [Desulfonema limicola]
MSEYRDDHLYINDICESVRAIESYIEDMGYEDFISDRKTYSATIRELEIIGEAVRNLSDELKNQYPDVVWQQIKSFRNKIVHEYFGIDYTIVWDVIKNELPILKSQILTIINVLSKYPLQKKP